MVFLKFEIVHGLMMMLHDGIFNKYMNWLAQEGVLIWEGGTV
jgi:hypothetical protein